MTIKDRLINLFNHNGCLTVNDSPLLNADIENDDGVLKINLKWEEEDCEYNVRFDASSLETAKEKDEQPGTFMLKDNISGEEVEVNFFRLEKLK